MKKIFLVMVFVIAVSVVAYAWPSSKTITPPFNGSINFHTGVNACGRLDKATGHMALAVANPLLRLGGPYHPASQGYGVWVDFTSGTPITASIGQWVRAIVKVEIPPESIVTNSFATAFVYVAIRNTVSGDVLSSNRFPLFSSGRLETRELVVTTDSMIKPQTCRVDVKMELRATKGGIGAVGNGFKLNSISVIAGDAPPFIPVRQFAE